MIDVDAANACLDALKVTDAAIARRAVDLTALIGHVGPEAAEGEIAGTLTLSRTGAAVRAGNAVAITSLPHLLRMLREGRVDEYRVLVAYQEMSKVISPADPRWSAVDRVVALVAPGMDSGTLRRHVHRLMIEIDPDKAHAEHLKAKQQREIRLHARAHGMSTIAADLSAQDAALVMATVNAIADLAPKDDPRTRKQLVADAFLEVFRAIGQGRPLRLIPTPTPPRDPAEPDYSLIPEQWMDTENDVDVETGTGNGPAGADPGGGSEPPECESPSDQPQFVPDLWHPPALGTHQGERLRVVLHLEAETLLGKNDLPAYLVGHGYITAQAGRDLARQCDSVDIVVRPVPSHQEPPDDPDPGPDSPDPGYPTGPGGSPRGPDSRSDADPHEEPGENLSYGRSDERRDPSCRGADLLALILRDRNCRQGRHSERDPHRQDFLHPPSIRIQTRAPVRSRHVHDPYRDEYRPRRALARRVMARNPHCRAPGCTRSARQCDLDHGAEWPGGMTCDCNLLPLCWFHHNLKTVGYWRYTMHPDGSTLWVTLLGRRYRLPPPDPVGR